MLTHEDAELAAKVALPVLGAAWAGVRWVYPKAKQAVSEAQGLVSTMTTVAADVAAIKKELYPNGGSSMRDTLDATRNDLRTLRHEVWVARAVQREVMDDQSGIGRFECDPYGQCVWVSQQWTEWTGIPVAEAVGNGWSGGIHSEDRERVFNAWVHAVTDRRPFALSFRYVHAKTGHETPVYVEAYPVEATTGECVGWVGTSRHLKGGT
jgi:PAS domain S-box-containing protein